MGWVRQLSLLLLLMTLSSALIIDSVDHGAAFANETAAAKCKEGNVQAVYTCNGDIVRVVSSVPGEGSTFYKPQGKVVSCPVVQPAQIGAECLAMMAPNFCPKQEVCGESPAPEVFPGQNDTPEQTGDADYYIVEGKGASENITEPAPENTTKPLPQKVNHTKLSLNALEVPVEAKNNIDWPLGSLVYVALFLGFASVCVLFLLFKNSLTEEEL